MTKKYFHTCMRRIIFLLTLLLMLIIPSFAWPAWQIEYTDEYLDMLRNQGEQLPPKRFGHFATRKEIEDAMEEWGREEGVDPWWIMHPAPGGFDEPGTSSSGGGMETEEKVWGEDGYGIPFYNIIKNIRQKSLDRRMEKARELNLKGNEEYDKKNWTEAIKLYREALESSPDDPVILENLRKAGEMEKLHAIINNGMDEYNRGDYGSAVKYFEEALKARPGNESLKEWLNSARLMLQSEIDSKRYFENARHQREKELEDRRKSETEQKRKAREAESALNDIQAESFGFLGKPSGATSSQEEADQQFKMQITNLQKVRVPVPPSFPVLTTDTIERDSSPVIELPPEVYQIIGFIGHNIKNAPVKLAEAVISAVDGDSHLGLIKIAKGLSDEAGRSMQSAVEVIGKGYPDSETESLIKGSETRAMKIYIESFSPVPAPFTEEEQQEMEINGRKWFNWMTGPLGENR